MTRRLLLSYVAITIVVLALLEVPLGIFYAQRERDRFGVVLERGSDMFRQGDRDVHSVLLIWVRLLACQEVRTGGWMTH